MVWLGTDQTCCDGSCCAATVHKFPDVIMTPGCAFTDLCIPSKIRAQREGKTFTNFTGTLLTALGTNPGLTVTGPPLSCSWLRGWKVA